MALHFRRLLQAFVKEGTQVAVHFSSGKAQLAGGGLFAVQFFKNFDGNGDGVILKLLETLGVV